MMTGWGRWVGRILAVGALALGAAFAPAAAQQTDDDCLCVDRDGNQIEDCACFRMPRFDTMMAPFPGARPRLGISVDGSQGSTLDAQGAHVTNVLEDGPAWDAGIREDDVITRIDSNSLFEPLPGDAEADFDLDESLPVQRLLALARELEPGDEVEVTFLRDGQERTATVLPEDLSDRSFEFAVPDFDVERFREQMRNLDQDMRGFQWRSPDLPEPPDALEVRIFGGGPGALFLRGASERYGIELVALNEGLGQYFGTSQGVLVVDVEEDSALGLQAGDVILRVGEREATTPERALRVLGSYEAGEDIPLHIRRDGREISVMGRLGN